MMLIAAAIKQTAAVTTARAGNSFAVRTFFRCGQNHPPKDKGHYAGKNQKQDSKMCPTGLGHLNSLLFPRPERQSNSTMWI
jgi:hypothetical protein